MSKALTPTINCNVIVENNQAITSSKDIAMVFGKRHDSVIRKIEQIMSEEVDSDFNHHNFVVVKYKDTKGEIRKAYNLTKDGFTFLAMSFTGKKAVRFKVAYINEFNRMAEELNQSLVSQKYHNTTTITDVHIFDVRIRIYKGLFSLDDLHKASGGKSEKRLAVFLKREQTKKLIDDLSKTTEFYLHEPFTRVKRGREAGTYACKEIVYTYAIWININFSSVVTRALHALEIPSAVLKDIPKSQTPPMLLDHNQKITEQINFANMVDFDKKKGFVVSSSEFAKYFELDHELLIHTIKQYRQEHYFESPDNIAMIVTSTAQKVIQYSYMYNFSWLLFAPQDEKYLSKRIALLEYMHKYQDFFKQNLDDFFKRFDTHEEEMADCADYVAETKDKFHLEYDEAGEQTLELLREEISANKRASRLLNIYLSIHKLNHEHSEEIVNLVKGRLDTLIKFFNKFLSANRGDRNIHDTDEFFKHLGLSFFKDENGFER